MEDIAAVNFNSANTVVPKSALIANGYTIMPSIQGRCADVFVYSNKSLTGAETPVKSSFDAYLCRFAPKIYMDKYLTEENIKNALRLNPKITEILTEHGLSPKIYIENVQGVNKKHFYSVYKKAKELGAELPYDKYIVLLQASLLHDIGKALIPENILNKPDALTPKEREIVDLHADLGAEILKTMNLNTNIIEAVRLHHEDAAHPKKSGNKTAQMVSVADVYSALSEKRPYKNKFSNAKVREIMQNDKKLNRNIVNQIFYQEDVPATSA